MILAGKQFMRDAREGLEELRYLGREGLAGFFLHCCLSPNNVVLHRINNRRLVVCALRDGKDKLVSLTHVIFTFSLRRLNYLADAQVNILYFSSDRTVDVVLG